MAEPVYLANNKSNVLSGYPVDSRFFGMFRWLFPTLSQATIPSTLLQPIANYRRPTARNLQANRRCQPKMSAFLLPAIASHSH